MKIGYKASAEQFGAQELLRFGLLAEEFGFDSVTVSDHFQPWRHHGGQAPNAFVWLGALAAQTQRVRLGTSVATPTFRYHPALVAQMAATIQSLAGGRFFLGIGTGESMNEVPLGIAWPEIKERFARMKEAAKLMGKLGREDFVTFDGDFYKTKNATIYERQQSGPVPLYIAGTGESRTPSTGRPSRFPATRRSASRTRARWSGSRPRSVPSRRRRDGSCRPTRPRSWSASAPTRTWASTIW
jgi:coenzyme F420-dependent glucose-6-phosphate dehydrogenase